MRGKARRRASQDEEKQGEREQDLRAKGGAEGDGRAEEKGVPRASRIGEAKRKERRGRDADGEGQLAQVVSAERDPGVIEASEQGRDPRRDPAVAEPLGEERDERHERGAERREEDGERGMVFPAKHGADEGEEDVGAVREKGGGGILAEGGVEHGRGALEVPRHVGVDVIGGRVDDEVPHEPEREREERDGDEEGAARQARARWPGGHRREARKASAKRAARSRSIGAPARPPTRSAEPTMTPWAFRTAERLSVVTPLAT